jgi:hypothetical protein
MCIYVTRSLLFLSLSVPPSHLVSNFLSLRPPLQTRIYTWIIIFDHFISSVCLLIKAFRCLCHKTRSVAPVQKSLSLADVYYYFCNIMNECCRAARQPGPTQILCGRARFNSPLLEYSRCIINSDQPSYQFHIRTT